MSCKHKKTLQIHGKCSDLCTAIFPDGREENGYVPGIGGIGGGDYIEIEVCMDCKVLVGFDPADVEEYMEGISEDERDPDEEEYEDEEKDEEDEVW